MSQPMQFVKERTRYRETIETRMVSIIETVRVRIQERRGNMESQSEVIQVQVFGVVSENQIM